MEPERFDAIVLGTGQAGKPLALDLGGAGRRTALVEREYVGGTCINVGCTPTKTMVASARVAYLARRAADYGVHGPPGPRRQGASELGGRVRRSAGESAHGIAGPARRRLRRALWSGSRGHGASSPAQAIHRGRVPNGGPASAGEGRKR